MATTRERCHVVGLAVGDDLLDVHGRRERVEREVTRIDDADAIRRREPQSAIRQKPAAGGLKPIGVECVLTPSELSKRWLLTERLGSAIHAPSSAELMLSQSARHQQPQRAVRVGDRPMNRVARQAIRRRQCGDAVVLDAAQAGGRRRPQRAILIELQLRDAPGAQPVGRVRTPRRIAPLFRNATPPL